MTQSVFDRVWNGSPAGGPKTNGVEPVHFLRSNAPAPAPPRPVLRPALTRSTLIEEARLPRHGRVWLYAFLAVFIFIGAWAYFGGYQAEASGRTTHPETTVEQQRNEVASTSEHDTPASITGAIIVRKPTSGVVCPNASSASAPYLAGAQTDPACLRYAPSMRR